MTLSQPSKLIEFLHKLGINPKKSLSQNFLIDGNIVKKIILSAEVQENDLIVEIGPGPGVLTEAFLEKKAFVIAVEMDDLFAKHLTRLDPSGTHLKIFNADVLEFPMRKILQETLTEHKKAKVVSNLPYQLTSPILGILLPQYDLIESLTIMVQKEFADRMFSKNNSSDYSSLSVFTQFYSTPKKLFNVSSHCFYPAPKVTSSVIKCTLKSPPLDVDPVNFFKIVKTAFNQRRKMLTTSLKDSFPQFQLSSILIMAQIDVKARPENLSLESWISLYHCLMNPET